MNNDFSKYYTPINVALPLVKMIKFKTNSNVIDICCGSGNLLQAAKNVKNTLFCSGVDIENVELLASELNVLLDKDKKPGQRKKAGLLITHLGYILNFVKADKAHVLMHGVIACSGDPDEILEDIRKEGFKGCVGCAECNS